MQKIVLNNRFAPRAADIDAAKGLAVGGIVCLVFWVGVAAIYISG